MNDKIRDFLKFYGNVVAACKTRIPAVAKDQLTEREWSRVVLSDFEICAISEYAIELVATYNDSCHCHPEDRTAHIGISWESIEEQL